MLIAVEHFRPAQVNGVVCGGFHGGMSPDINVIFNQHLTKNARIAFNQDMIVESNGTAARHGVSAHQNVMFKDTVTFNPRLFRHL